MIKVMHIITDTNIGGAGRLLINYLKNFNRDLLSIVVVVPEASALIPLIKAEGYPVITTKLCHDKSYERGAVRELKQIIQSEKPDIVHTHSAFAAKLAAYLCGVKSRIYTRHCAFEMPKKLTTFPGKQINGFINNTLASAIVSVAPACTENLVDTGISEKKITLIMNGVEPVRRITEDEKAALRAKLGIKDGDFVCGISARLEPYKGHSYLLRAAEIVIREIPNVKFIIMGDGSVKEELIAAADRAGISENVIFTGFADDIAPYYNIMDLALNSSWGTEASSLALAETMSLSLPSVVSDFGGNPYVIKNNVNGLVVPQKSGEAMAQAIIRIIKDKELYRVLSEGAGKEYLSRFTASAMTRSLEELYVKEAKRIKACGN